MLDGDAYIAYSIGLFLLAYDPDFDALSIDEEWTNRVVPLTKKFKSSKYNKNDKSLMDCLNEFLRDYLEKKEVKNE